MEHKSLCNSLALLSLGVFNDPSNLNASDVTARTIHMGRMLGDLKHINITVLHLVLGALCVLDPRVHIHSVDPWYVNDERHGSRACLI
jgi:hypothetical protein